MPVRLRISPNFAKCVTTFETDCLKRSFAHCGKNVRSIALILVSKLGFHFPLVLNCFWAKCIRSSVFGKGFCAKILFFQIGVKWLRGGWVLLFSPNLSNFIIQRHHLKFFRLLWFFVSFLFYDGYIYGILFFFLGVNVK